MDGSSTTTATVDQTAEDILTYTVSDEVAQAEHDTAFNIVVGDVIPRLEGSP
jgi:hypothetical protein